MKLSQNQIILPLLETLSEAGDEARTGDVYDVVADKLNVPGDIRDERISISAGSRFCEINAFERTVRWAQQTAKLMGLVEPVGKPYWRITGKGKDALKEALPGVVVTIFTTPKGVALFASCEDAVAYIDDASVNLIFTSPPYPLIRQKHYGNVSADSYIEWFLRLAEKFPRKMARDASFVVNLGDVCENGSPNFSLYQERLLLRLHDELGFKLCQKFYWHSPTKLPVPKTWVSVRRVRVKPSVEQIYWLSPSDNPYADNSKVLNPYSKTMLKLIAQGGEKRKETHPSNHSLRIGAYANDNGGSIPGNVLISPHSESNNSYIKSCRQNGLPVHPARFPRQLPEFFIKFLTRPDDLVFDPFAGSNVTAQEAERLGRRWITSEIIREYVEGARYRFAA